MDRGTEEWEKFHSGENLDEELEVSKPKKGK